MYLQDLIDNIPRNLPIATPKANSNTYPGWDGTYKNDYYKKCGLYGKYYGYPEDYYYD